MEEKSSGKKKKARRTTKPPASAEEAVTVAEAVSLLTDDLIVEILSRLPARSVHRFKCASPSWRDLIADPANRKKLPHTLAGFLYSTYDSEDPRFQHFHFANVSDGAAPSIDPLLRFLPLEKYLYVIQLDTCNGLLLCHCYMAHSSPPTDENAPVECHYVVCNPGTGRWVDLPLNSEVQDGHRILARLAFDPAVSSHFHVLQFEETDQEKCVTGVNIYSSQTGAWKHRQSRLVEKISLFAGLTSVFFHGMLHLLALLYPMKMDDDVVLLAVDLERQDYDSKQWALKHSTRNDELQISIPRLEYKVAAIHPDCDTIFLDTCDDETLAAYDMQHRKFHRILNLRKNKAVTFLPYVPLFSDSFADYVIQFAGAYVPSSLIFSLEQSLKNFQAIQALKHTERWAAFPRPAIPRADCQKATRPQKPSPRKLRDGRLQEAGPERTDSQKPAIKRADSQKPAIQSADSQKPAKTASTRTAST
uniref:Uncharacterized protein n=1 Tax=Aegilops tauschii TaxID=37682 RepID=M8CFM7_AEGTA